MKISILDCYKDANGKAQGNLNTIQKAIELKDFIEQRLFLSKTFSPYTYSSTIKNKVNSVAMTALVFDIETKKGDSNVYTQEQLLEDLNKIEYKYYCYPSQSATKEDVRARLIIELEEDVYDSREVKPYYLSLAHQLLSYGIPLDLVCTKNEDRMYFPTLTANTTDGFEYFFVESKKPLLSKEEFFSLPIVLQENNVATEDEANGKIDWNDYCDKQKKCVENGLIQLPDIQFLRNRLEKVMSDWSDGKQTWTYGLGATLIGNDFINYTNSNVNTLIEMLKEHEDIIGVVDDHTIKVVKQLFVCNGFFKILNAKLKIYEGLIKDLEKRESLQNYNYLDNYKIPPEILGISISKVEKPILAGKPLFSITGKYTELEVKDKLSDKNHGKEPLFINLKLDIQYLSNGEISVALANSKKEEDGNNISHNYHQWKSNNAHFVSEITLRHHSEIEVDIQNEADVDRANEVIKHLYYKLLDKFLADNLSSVPNIIQTINTKLKLCKKEVKKDAPPINVYNIYDDHLINNHVFLSSNYLSGIFNNLSLAELLKTKGSINKNVTTHDSISFTVNTKEEDLKFTTTKIISLTKEKSADNSHVENKDVLALVNDIEKNIMLPTSLFNGYFNRLQESINKNNPFCIIYNKHNELQKYKPKVEELITINDTFDVVTEEFKHCNSTLTLDVSIPKPSKKLLHNLSLEKKQDSNSYWHMFTEIVKNITRDQNGNESFIIYDFVMAQLAYFIQNPTAKLPDNMRGCTVFQGMQGAGKSVFLDICKHIMGKNIISLKGDVIKSVNTTSMNISPEPFMQARFIALDEFRDFTNAGSNTLKSFVYEKEINFAQKYKHPVSLEVNYTCFLAYNTLTNYEGIKKFLEEGTTNRRYAIGEATIDLQTHFNNKNISWEDFADMLDDKNREELVAQVIAGLRNTKSSYCFNEFSKIDTAKKDLLESKTTSPEGELTTLLKEFNDNAESFVKLHRDNLSINVQDTGVIVAQHKNLQWDYSIVKIPLPIFNKQYWNKKIPAYRKKDFKDACDAVINKHNLKNLTVKNLQNVLYLTYEKK